MNIQVTFSGPPTRPERLPTTLDLAEIYFDKFGPGSIGASCVHLASAVERHFRDATPETLRPIADQLAAERPDARVHETDPAHNDHPWYLIIGTAPASRLLDGADVLTTMAEDFGTSRWVAPSDLVRHVQRRVGCSAYAVSKVCRDLAERGRARIRGEMGPHGEGEWAFRIN